MNMRTSTVAIRPRRAAGFTLIEVLIAAGLLLLIAVGVLPLFAQSLLNNVKGSDATQTSNVGVTALETAARLRFQAPDATVPFAGTQLDWATQYRLINSADWVSTYSAAASVHYVRDVSVRQYQITEIETTGVLGAPLAGSATPGEVQLKLVEVRVGTGILTPPRPIFTADLLKSF